MKKYTAIDVLFETGLRHLYKAEKAILKTLPKMEDTAEDFQLKSCFKKHFEETQHQIHRLEQIFKILNIDIKASKIQGMTSKADQAKELLKTLVDMNFTDRSVGLDGILKEGKELLRHFAKTDANELALVSAGQKVEHFEIACYKFLSLLGLRYGTKDVTNLLQESLHEEIRMEKRISEFAEKHMNAEVV